MKEILGHFARLFQFGGREKVGSFWPYAGVVLALGFIGSAAVMMPEMNRSMARMAQFAAEHPESATVSQGPGRYEIHIQGSHPELLPDFKAMIGGMVAVMVIMVVLLAAAVARRLHDTGRTGAWGLLSLPFLVSGMALMPDMFSSAEPDMSQFFMLFADNMVYIGTLVLLVFLLSRPGDPAENRWGPPQA